MRVFMYLKEKRNKRGINEKVREGRVRRNSQECSSDTADPVRSRRGPKISEETNIYVLVERANRAARHRIADDEIDSPFWYDRH